MIVRVDIAVFTAADIAGGFLCAGRLAARMCTLVSTLCTFACVPFVGFSLDSHLAATIIFFLVFFAVKFPNRFACVICRVKVAVFFITEFALCFFSTSRSAAHMVFKHGYFFFTCDDKTVFEFCRSVNRHCSALKI